MGLAQKLTQLSCLQRDYDLLRETLVQEQTRLSALEVEKRTAVQVHPWRILKLTDPAAYVSLMRDNAAKRNISSSAMEKKERHRLPNVWPKRPVSDSSLQYNDLQSALIKSVL